MSVTPWQLATIDPLAQKQLADALGMSQVMAGLLLSRGFNTPQEAREYLDPKLSALSHPFTLIDMEKAATRLRQAIRKDEKIVVYGDYDVDGMTGTVVLMNFVQLAGGRVSAYIPNRLKEGYSFNPEAIDALLDSDDPPKVVITVDHGISAHEGIKHLAERGVDVIVTDHHEPPSSLPEHAYAMVNPRRADCPSTFKHLCGAAVAYKLAWAAAESFTGNRKLSPEFREYLLDSMALVSLATVTDIVPLRGENRVLCFHGLQALPVSKNPGIQALLGTARLKGSVVRAVHVGFRIGPRLNAAGRMGMAEVAIELLTTKSSDRARTLAQRLEKANDQRRIIEKEMLREILEHPDFKDVPKDRGICVGKVGWHVGVIGIVANRLVDRFQVPAFVAGLNGDHGRGSCRTIPGVNLKEVLDSLSEHLVAHGGHAGAAGATVTEDAFPAFKTGFMEKAGEAMRAITELPALEIDMELPFRHIKPSLLEEMERLAPHGAANPPAVFAAFGVSVAGRPTLLGKDRAHLEMHIREGDRTFRAVGFGKAQLLELVQTKGVRLDIAYRLKFDSYRKPGSIELELKDVRLAQS